jgi:hypothetical protein
MNPEEEKVFMKMYPDGLLEYEDIACWREIDGEWWIRRRMKFEEKYKSRTSFTAVKAITCAALEEELERAWGKFHILKLEDGWRVRKESMNWSASTKFLALAAAVEAVRKEKENECL